MFYGLIHDPELNAAIEEDSDEEEDKEKPKVPYLLQSMLGRNWCNNVFSHVRVCLHERLLFIIWKCTCDLRLMYSKYRVSCCLKHVKCLI